MHVTTQHTVGSSCELHFTFGAEQALDFTKTRINVMHSAYLILRKLTCHILFFSSTCKCWSSSSVPTPGSDNLNIDCSWGPGSSTCHAEELAQLPCLIQAEVIRENRKASICHEMEENPQTCRKDKTSLKTCFGKNKQTKKFQGL